MKFLDRKGFFLFSLAFVLTGQNLKAQTPAVPIPTYDQAASLVEEGRKTLQEDPLLQAQQALDPCGNTVTGRFDCCYQRARACLYLSRACDLDKHRKEAEKWDDVGIGLAQKTLLFNPQSADAHSLLALLYETKLSYGDMFTGMSIGPKVGDENKKALALEPDNPQVLLAAGIQYVMAPPIGGGDVKKGKDSLQKVLELDPNLDEADYWLAIAFRKQNNREGFKKALESALKLNPQNRMAQKELEDWK